MKNTVRLFMWGFQPHFQISVKCAAERLFQSLHPDFEVETFLLGIAREDAKDVHPVCLEPEDCGFEPGAFEEVRAQAVHHRALDPERNLMGMLEAHQRSINNRVIVRAWRKAVLDVLNGWGGGRRGEYYFIGSVPVDQHEVGVVLRLHFRGKESPYRLPKVKAEERYGVPHSLVEAAVRAFLADCTNALCVPSPTAVDTYRGRDQGELLREAGQWLMDAPVWAGSDPTHLSGLFGSCNQIAAMTYESAGSVGSLLIARANHPNVERTLSLAFPVHLSETRRVRKLLQVAASGDSLLCDGSKVIGLGHRKGYYDQSWANLFEVRFLRHHHWELRHDEHAMMRVRYGNPALPRPPLDAAKLTGDLGRVFPGLPTDHVAQLVTLALAACKQRHGALLVISAEAETEARRLAKQSTLIEPLALTEQLLGAVAAIDGAVLLAPDATCYAIGVILDGLATPEGDPARGARFNSSLRYVAGRVGCLAVIVSEDGSAEWVPDLLPCIRRADLEAKRGEVERLLAQGELDSDRSHDLLRWLSQHRFYLNEAFCEMANALATRHQQECQREGRITLSYERFTPSAEMNSDYITE